VYDDEKKATFYFERPYPTGSGRRRKCGPPGSDDPSDPKYLE
jgi:hypothetical protein